MNMQTKHDITETIFHTLSSTTNYGRPSVTIGLMTVDTAATNPYYSQSPMVTIEFTTWPIKPDSEYYTKAHWHAKVYPNSYPLECDATKDAADTWHGWVISGDIRIKAGWGDNVEDAAKLLQKVVAGVRKMTEKYNLEYKYNADVLALWLDALGKLGIIRMEKNYANEWRPVEQPKRKAA